MKRNDPKYHKQYREEKRKNLDWVLTYAVGQAKIRARQKEIPFDLTPEYIIEMAKEQNYSCCISGRKFNAERGEFRVGPDTPSLDRIKPDLGYVKGNIRLTSWFVNSAIGEYGLENFLELCRDVKDFMEIK